MGRVRQMRKFKACDPCHDEKGKRKVREAKKKQEIKFNLPPTGKNCVKDVHFEETYKVKRVNEILALGTKEGQKAMREKKKKFKEIGKQIGGPTSKKSGKKQAATDEKKRAELKKQPGESNKEFFTRLDNRVQRAMGKVFEEAKPLRKKRKKHLQARDEKIKQKKTTIAQESENVRDFHHLKDDVSFGEVALRPPEFSAKPRKAQKLDAANPNRTKNFHFTKIMNDNSSSSNESKQQSSNSSQKPTNKSTNSPANPTQPTKRKDMSAGDQMRFDARRQDAIDAYRLIKKRKEDARAEAAGT